MNKPPYGDDLRRLNAETRMLKVSAQYVADMTVRVERGSFWISRTFCEFAGGISPKIAVPTVGAYWVVIALKPTGNLQVIYGQVADDNQQLPNITSDVIPLAAIFIKAEDTVITDDMIFDMRPVYAANTYIEKHNALKERDIEDAHPMSSITGLEDALNEKLTETQLTEAMKKKADIDGTSAKSFTLNSKETGAPSSDVYIAVNRGNQPTASIRYNENENRWEFTDDGQQFHPFDTTIEVDPFNEENYYTRVDVDDKLARINSDMLMKASQQSVNLLTEKIAGAASLDYVNNKFNNLYTKQDLDNIVAEVRRQAARVENKVNRDEVYLKPEVDSMMTELRNDARIKVEEIETNINTKYTDVKGDVNVINEDIINIRQAIEDLKNESETADEQFMQKLEEEYISINDNLVIKANADDVYTKPEVDAAIAAADKTSDYYTKAQVDAKLNSKASINDVYQYTHEQVTTAMSYKQDKLEFTPEDTAKKNVANGYAGLDANGKISLALLPDTTKQQTFVIANETERAALTNLIAGMKCYETETGNSYIYTGSEWKVTAKADWENINIDFSNIAGTPDTLAGYGIGDAYTKAETDTLMAGKAETSHTHAPSDIETDEDHMFFTKAQADALAAKANLADVYTQATANDVFVRKMDLNNTLANYSDTDTMNHVISEVAALKADKETTYTKIESDELLLKKADADKTYTKIEADDAFAAKSNTYTKAEVDAAITTNVNNAVSTKANAADVYTKSQVYTRDDLYTKAETFSKDEINEQVAALQTAVDGKVSTSQIWNTQAGYFETTYNHANGSYAKIWNESDGGGSLTLDSTSNVLSYVGTNLEEGNSAKDSAINVQIYSKDKTTNAGVRINVSTKKAYYLQGTSKSNTDGREIAVKDDVNALLARIEELEAKVAALENPENP